MAERSSSVHLAKEVTSNLQKITTTTVLTFETLQRLLGYESKIASIEKTVEPKKARNVGDENVRGRKASKAQSQDEKNVKTAKSSDDRLKPITAEARRKLATEAFNSTLRCLTSAVKAKQDPTSSSALPGKRPSSSKSTTDPLQPRSPNKRTKDPADNISYSVDSGGIGHVADCTTIALDYLWELESQDDKESEQCSRLEKGALIILDRLISLGLRRQAHEQSWKWHERYWKRRKATSPIEHGNHLKPGSGLPVSFSSKHIDEVGFRTVASYQSQILRLAILEGSQAVNDVFMASIKATADGSPAKLVLNALGNGHITKTEAGQHLRTIGQALLKIHSISISDKQQRVSKCFLNLSLLIEALLIKVESWRLLKPDIDLDRDFWAHLLKGLARLEADCGQRDMTSTKFVYEAIHSAHSSLRKEFPGAAIPASIIHKLIDMAETAGCFDQGLQILRGYDDGTNSPSIEQQAYFCWRAATLGYKCGASQRESLPCLLKEASTSFQHIRNIRVEHANNMFLYGARLRKTVLALTRDQKLLVPDDCAENDVYTSCVRILSGLLRLLTEHMSSAKEAKTVETWRLGYTTFAKTFEAILEATKSQITSAHHSCQYIDVEIQQAVGAASDLTNTASTIVPNGEVTTFIETLVVQTSNLYWIRYVGQDGRLPIPEDRLTSLSIACNIVAGLSTKLQQSASYGMKLEKLALSHLAEKDIVQACQCFNTAIKHYMALGGLKLAADTALSSSSQAVWSQQRTKSYSMGHALQSLTKLCLTYGLPISSNDSWVYESDNLSDFERMLLFECQLLAVVDHDFSKDQGEICHNKCLVLLDLCNDPRLEIYRIRFLSRLLFVLSRNDSLSQGFPSTSKIFKDLPTDTSVSKTEMPLSKFACSLHHVLSLQMSMRPGVCDVSSIRQNVKALSSFILGLSDTAAFDTHIDDLNLLVNQIQAVLDFGQMLDDIDLMLACLQAIKHILTINKAKDSTKTVEGFAQLATLYHRMGNMTQAGRTFTETEILLDESTQRSDAYNQWALSYVEYLLDLSNTTNAMELFSRITECFQVEQSVELFTGRERLEKQASMSRAANIAASISLQQGNHDAAYRFARQAVRLSTEIWQAIDRSHNINASSSTPNNQSPLHSLTADMSNLALSSDQVFPQRKAKGNSYWRYAQTHYSSLQRMIDISIHSGLYQDAIFYAQQLQKLATSMGSNTRLCRATTMSALISSKAGHKAEALDLLKVSRQVNYNSSCLEDQHNTLARVEALIGIDDLDTASSLLGLLSKPVESAEPLVTTNESSKKGIHKAPVRGKAKVTRPTKAPPKRPGHQQTVAKPTTGSSSQTSMTKNQHYIRERCRTLQMQIDLARDTPLLQSSDIAINHEHVSGTTDTSVVVATTLLKQAMASLSSDAVRCVLAETAVALPVRYRSSRKSGRVSFIQALDSPKPAKPSRAGRSKVVIAQQKSAKGEPSLAKDLMTKAQKMLRCLDGGQNLACTLDVLHLAYKIQSKVGLLASTLNVPFLMSSSELVLQSLAPKDIVQRREALTVTAERSTRTKAQLSTWPDMERSVHGSLENTIFDCTMDDLSEIPESWSILTISLSDNQQEILVSKIVGIRSPFLLRIPLSRSEFEADEDAGFSFADAKTELTEIVGQANTSAHDTRGQGDREMRKAWYAEREELNDRLEAWACNIQNIWLGGFRGLMSSIRFNDDTLSSFAQALNQIFNTHLPSRQKNGISTVNKVTLHAHVLELFLGLGHPDDQELEDALTDLLYFVVDILQFSGEPNAYDEIDFDAMLVDVLDLLRTCHESNGSHAPDHHTILIVDKELNSFPWEALPCLQEQSVSRMPSLNSVIQRIKKMRAQSVTAQGYLIPAEKGAYILNPSSDLKSTQATFEPIFSSQLPSYTNKVNTTPTEPEFASLLTTHPLLLYFGHGSGAQYIRGRTIRDLDTCAVTLLMGCSSAKMTECGKFESYGMPGYYMGGMSGCMAVVGTLWDVTDRDIDRFAVNLMVEWGLIAQDENVKKTLQRSNQKRNKGQMKELNVVVGGGGVSMEEKRGKVSLDQAVSRSRDACLLRYLNGAAPVVYGIPVFLK